MTKQPNDIIQATVVLMNSRLELDGLRDHAPNGNARTRLSLAIGVLDEAINYLMTGKTRSKHGLFTALLAIE